MIRTPDRYDLAAAVILLTFTAVSFSVISRNGITNDELAHISAGYSYIKTGDFRMNVEHPPLIKLLSGLALLPLNPRLPLEHPSWTARKEWIFGDRFFYVANKNADQIVFFARIPVIFVGALLIFFVYLFARSLFGPVPGLLAAGFTALDPLVIAMSTVVHTDIGVTAFGFITVFFFWQFMNRRTKLLLVLTSTSLGLTLASKFTGLYFIAILGIIAAGSTALQGYHEHHRWNRHAIKTLWGQRAQQLYILLAVITVGAGILFLATYHFTQINYLIMGLRDVTLHSSVGHRSFLHGVHSDTGFWYYFPIAFLIKTPVPSLAFILFGILLSLPALFTFTSPPSPSPAADTKQEDASAPGTTTIIDNKHETRSLSPTLFLLIPVLIYLGLFMINRINIGVRHILPIYPFLYVFASRIANWKPAMLKPLLLILLTLLAWNAYAIHPHYLSSFNIFIGGPDRGHEWLIDSNIDWGQDLKGLGIWLSERGNPTVKMAYFGLDDREYRNITWEELRCGPQAGLIAISVNHLVGFDANLSHCSAWLRKRKPIAKIGYSIFMYNVTAASILQEQQDYCRDKCKEKCHQEQQVYIKSHFNETCHCTCTTA